MIKSLFILIVFSLSSSVCAETFPLHTFYSKDGKVVGKLYVEFTRSNIIKSAEIRDGGKILYTIDDKGFSDQHGVQMKCDCSPYYGYTIKLLTSLKISVILSDKEGREVSDAADIQWDEKDKKFSLMLLP